MRQEESGEVKGDLLIGLFTDIFDYQLGDIARDSFLNSILL